MLTEQSAKVAKNKDHNINTPDAIHTDGGQQIENIYGIATRPISPTTPAPKLSSTPSTMPAANPSITHALTPSTILAPLSTTPAPKCATTHVPLTASAPTTISVPTALATS